MFKATDRGHNCASDKNMLPAGAEGWNGKLNSDVEVKFDVPGVYGYYCTPHRGVGMVGLVLVGNVTQAELDTAAGVRQRGKARARYEDYFAEASSLL